MKALVIYPAEEKHLKKYEKQFSSFIHETPEWYEKATLPFIQNSSYSKQVEIKYMFYHKKYYILFYFSGFTIFWKRNKKVNVLFVKIWTPKRDLY